MNKVNKKARKKKLFKINRKAFSLVELLAVVVILGLLAAIGIVATSSLIDRSKQDKMDSQKNTVTMSAQTYMQNNKNLVPKIIGESRIIKVSDLRASNYLTEDIKNDKGESCMEKSYVRVYKLSNSEYTYTTFLYCGDEEVPEEEIVPAPIVSAKFSDSTGEIKDELLNNVSDAYLYIDINAASDSDIQEYKNNGNEIAIDGYTFKIFVVRDGEKTEAYNSGSLSGGQEQKIIINKKLDDYIDVTGVTQVSLEVTVINTLGGITNTTIGESGEVSSSTYDDNVKPKCIKPESPYSEDDWLDKNEYNTTKLQRKLTVGCDDGTGSGCIRNNFTMSWPNDDDQYGAEYVYIEVKDNAGNVSEKNDACRFRVNVDIKTPEATVTAYVGSQSNSNDTATLASKITGSNILKKDIKVNNSTTTKKIEPTTEYYKSLVGNSTDDKWMNNQNYPNGVVYKIELKDNIRLDKWTWKTNAGYISSTKSKNYLDVSLSNPESSSGSIAQDEAHGMTILHGSTHDTVYVRFYTEGMRYGVFTAYDKAGNKIEIEIAANLDRTAPPVPNSLVAYVYNKVRTGGTTPSSTSYSFGTWTNRYVRVKTAEGQNRDDLTNGVNLSGFWQFYYDARNNAGNSVGSGDYSTYSSGIGLYDFKGTASEVDGKNKIRFMSCDKAGNCSAYGDYKQAWIDITVPTCTVNRTLNGSESSYGWLGAGETARVTATCNDPTTTLASGCTVSSFYNDYTSNINTTTAGAKGNGNGGSFSDAAGNSVTCAANQRIQIDHDPPKCSVSGGSNSWTNKSRTVTGKCTDTGGSQCVGNISHTYDYDIWTSTGGAAGNNKGGSVKDKADNETPCSANQTVKVDRTNPTFTASPAPNVFYQNEDLKVTIGCDDNLSGVNEKNGALSFKDGYTFTVSAPTSALYHGKCCADNAGNEVCGVMGPWSIKIYGRHEDCGVETYKSCRTSGCGVELYKSCRNANCGVESYNKCTNSACGYTYGTGLRSRGGGACSAINGTYLNGVKYTNCVRTTSSLDDCTCTTTKTKSCRTAACGVELYYSCRDASCGVERYNKCRDAACGVEYHAQCWHYENNCDCPH